MHKSSLNSQEEYGHHATLSGSVCCPMHAHWKTPLVFGYNYGEKYMQTLYKPVIKLTEY
jgi:hypothetical protein